VNDEKLEDAGLVNDKPWLVGADVGLSIRSLPNGNPGARRGGNVMGDGGGRAEKDAFEVVGAKKPGDTTGSANEGGGGEGSEDRTS
jgi:hypothetical protein